MKTLALLDGDLMVGATGHVTVSGGPKIKQDLSLALGEDYGNDRFHPTLGSTVPNMVGMPLGPDSPYEVRSEVSRVISSYIETQGSAIIADVIAGTRSRYVTSDVVQRVDEIAVRVDWDAIRLKATLSTQAGDTVEVQQQVVI